MADIHESGVKKQFFLLLGRFLIKNPLNVIKWFADFVKQVREGYGPQNQKIYFKTDLR